MAIQGDGKIVAVGSGGHRLRRLRARPLQPERLARHELLRRRQADDRLRGFRRRRTGWRSRATARSSRSASQLAEPAAATSRSPATTRTARSTRASPATASRRPTSASGDAANGVALQGDGKIVAVGRGAAAAATTSRSPATTQRRRSTRASPATASRRPTSGFRTDRRGERGGPPGGRQDRRGGRRHWPDPDGRFRDSSLSRGLSHARVDGPRHLRSQTAGYARRQRGSVVNAVWRAPLALPPWTEQL